MTQLFTKNCFFTFIKAITTKRENMLRLTEYTQFTTQLILNYSNIANWHTYQSEISNGTNDL